MSPSSRPKAGQGDYEVGYGRTPKATRFKPGQSGNPRGRPKAPKSVAVMLQEALAARITVQENGRTRSLTMQEVIIRGLVRDAARRNHTALRVLLSLIDRYRDSAENTVDPTHFEPEDQAIIQDFLAQQLATAAGTHRANSVDTASEVHDKGSTDILPDKGQPR